MLGDPGSLKAEKTDSDPVPGKQNQDGGTVDLASSSSSSSSPGKGRSGVNAADADSGDFGASKEENKNFDPRKYLDEKKGQQGSGEKKIEGIEWTDKKPPGANGEKSKL